MTKNLHRQQFGITREDRESLLNQNSKLIWFTGLSGSGKSTIANALESYLHDREILTYTLDGDNIRFGLNKDLTFSAADRTENLRRIAEVAKLMIDSGVVTIASFISPLISDREMIRDIVGSENFLEVFVNTSLEECERRDVKGLYKKARAGEIDNFTGISAPYEAPLSPDIEIKTEELAVNEAVNLIYDHIKSTIVTK